MSCLRHVCVCVNSLRRMSTPCLMASTSYNSVYHDISFFFRGQRLLNSWWCTPRNSIVQPPSVQRSPTGVLRATNPDYLLNRRTTRPHSHCLYESLHILKNWRLTESNIGLEVKSLIPKERSSGDLLGGRNGEDEMLNIYRAPAVIYVLFKT